MIEIALLVITFFYFAYSIVIAWECYVENKKQILFAVLMFFFWGPGFLFVHLAKIYEEIKGEEDDDDYYGEMHDYASDPFAQYRNGSEETIDEKTL